jgi:hypothetical protein
VSAVGAPLLHCDSTFVEQYRLTAQSRSSERVTRRILIVDDDSELREALVEQLERDVVG